MTSTDTKTPIDEKKKEETYFKDNFKEFIKNYLSTIILTVGFSIFVIGTVGLYSTKVSQANIVPDDIDLAPYTVIDRIIKDIPIDINIMRPFMWSDNNETVSQKAIFKSREYLDSFNGSVFCYLKKNAGPDSGVFSNGNLFFSMVYDNILSKLFSLLNLFYFTLSYLPEWVIMLLTGMLGVYILLILCVICLCLSVVYHIINIPELFREGEAGNEYIWESREDICFFRPMKLLKFFYIWLPLSFFSILSTSVLMPIYSIIAPLYAKYNIKQNGNKTYGFFDFMKDTFAYKKFFFFILSTIALCYNGVKYLGNMSLIGIAFAVLFAYIMGLYENKMPESGVNGFTAKIRQNVKQATVTVDSSNPQLVKICEPLPTNNRKVEKLSKKGAYRKVLKETNVGGMEPDTTTVDNQPLENNETIDNNQTPDIVIDDLMQTNNEDNPVVQVDDVKLFDESAPESVEPAVVEPAAESTAESVAPVAAESVADSADSVAPAAADSVAESVVPVVPESAAESPAPESPAPESPAPVAESAPESTQQNVSLTGGKRVKKYNVRLV